ncbi:hypothetical protein [Leptospira stimsonii]|uniref:DUF2029 domain-containing protein n=1 Tax=Leptospira stimsonii TaxID=2202203 RepID=A0A8B3CMH2_9LEPT|nr:hypothetical protein [Leptospira stimsonii]RHX84546.1 hypothetical protein DLM78_17670 [Leptospira stimsonii]
MIKRPLLISNFASTHIAGSIAFLLYISLFLFWKRLPGTQGLVLYLSAYLILFGIVLLPFSQKADDSDNLAGTWFWGILFRLTAILTFPVWEDDWARFLWDGYQTLETGTPYGKPPETFFSQENLPAWSTEILSRINHPEVPTIYGPCLQILFWISAFLFPGSLLGLKCIYFLIEIFGWSWMQKHLTKKDFRIVFWFPLLIIETYIQAHPDFLGLILLSGVYILNKEKKRFWIAGILLGIACSVKVFAWILLPFCLLRTKRVPFLLGFVTAFLSPYLFFRIQGGVGGDGLSIFLESWEFNSSLYAFLKWILGRIFFDTIAPWTVGLICLGLCGLGGLYFLIHSDSDEEKIVGNSFLWFFLFSPVVNPWYLLWSLFFWIRSRDLSGIVFSGVVVLSYVSGKNLSFSSGLQLYENPLWILILEYTLVGLAFFIPRFSLKNP